MAPNPGALQHKAQGLAATLPPLLVAADRIAAIVSQGVHGRRRVGQGETFWQFRRYQSGDPAQAIDWRQSARGTPLFVRETEWAGAQSVWLWRDGSNSMRYRSHRNLPEKEERASLLLLALAALLVRAGERIALAGDARAPATGRAVLSRLAQTLPTQPPGSGLPPAAPLPRHANTVLFSDFLTPLDEIDAAVRRLAGGGVRGHLVQILDPAEDSLPFTGRVLFDGLEGEGETLIRRTEDVRTDYTGRMRAHQAGLSAIARAAGWTFTVHHTDMPPQAALLALHAALGGNGR